MPRRFLVFAAAFAALAALYFLASAWTTPKLPATVYSKEILASNGQVLHLFLAPDQKWRLQTVENQLPPKLIEWIAWKEDKYFRYHPGFNPVALVRSLLQNLASGRRLSGASTITMQAVRLHHNRPRTWTSKIIEIAEAVMWEMRLSKTAIFNFYISHLPFGGNVEGFRAASRRYFGKEPNQLTTAQCAALVVIPNHPEKLHPLRHPEALHKKRNQFLTKLHTAGFIDHQEWKSATLEPVFASRNPMPVQAPHLARVLRNGEKNPVQTTIDPQLQQAMERLLALYHHRLQRLGIANAAALLADAETGEIKAWIGNPEFADAANAGEVDGVTALRSPGSTLKPFIYALALQQGLITPKTTLFDIPQRFGTYQPENFDKGYHGAVSAGFALLQSLNIPAIGLLHQVGIDSLMHTTDRLGMHLLRHKTRRPGLSLAVGGCGTSLFELVQAYTAIANMGKATSLVWAKGQQAEVTQVFTPAVAEAIRHMLSVSKRSEAILPFAQNPGASAHVGWKTGTSFGHRDAWCIGFGKRYVLGVWFGNFSGQGNAALSGIEVAAPVFQQLLSVAEQKIVAPDRPNLEALGWKRRSVCAHTGLPPGVYCSNLVSDGYLPLVSTQTTCAHRKQVITNPDETISYCLLCAPATGTKTIVADNPLPAFLAYSESKGTSYHLAPPHNPACMQAKATSALTIALPTPGQTYFLDGKQEIELDFEVLADKETFPIAFYLNGQHVASASYRQKTTCRLKAGVYTLTATDNSGNSATSKFYVKDF